MSEQPSTLGHVTALAQRALDQLDDPAVASSTVARTALRVARLRNDWEGAWWLQLELTGIPDGSDAAAALTADMRPHFTVEDHAAAGYRVGRKFVRGRTVAKDKMHGWGLPALEEHIEGMERQLAELVVPEGMHPQDIYFRSEALMKPRADLRAAITTERTVLARVRSAVGDYLAEAERQLLFGRVNADIFERNRAYVDSRLATLAPEALEQFTAAYRRHAEGDAEAGSHALTSCRRVLKTLADALFPATDATVTGIDGIERKMTDDKYVSRLCQYAGDSTAGSASQGLIVAQVNALGNRLDALNRLSSKGVHAAVSSAEVDQCLIQTYLAVGDLLRIEDGQSAALAA